MELFLIHPGIYTSQETFRQQASDDWLCLCLTGLDYLRVFSSEGTPLTEITRDDGACLLLVPAGLWVEFSFGVRRANWVFQCHIPALRNRPGGGSLLRCRQDGEIALPLFKPLTSEHALALRERFTAVRELWLDGTPGRQLAAELATLGLLAEFISAAPPVAQPSPVVHFRQLIDKDARFEKSLDDLAREAGRSLGYLRRGFRQKYLIDPGEYRRRRRVGRIMTLIDSSSLGIKEIASDVGLRHVTHLHKLMKKYSGRTPGELLRLHRGAAVAAPGAPN